MTNKDISSLARIVFGEARGERKIGQRAVAYTMLNRLKHEGYPKTLHEVMYQKDSDGQYQYVTLGDKDHDRAWKEAKENGTSEYKKAMSATEQAFFGRRPDPTGGATDYAATDPNPAISDNDYWRATKKKIIGNHTFVCRERKSH